MLIDLQQSCVLPGLVLAFTLGSHRAVMHTPLHHQLHVCPGKKQV